LFGTEGLLARSKPDSHNTKSWMVFLKALKRFAPGQRVIRIGDHLPAHRSQVRKRFLFEHGIGYRSNGYRVIRLTFMTWPTFVQTTWMRRSLPFDVACNG
jgi:hypothetical protein